MNRGLVCQVKTHFYDDARVRHVLEYDRFCDRRGVLVEHRIRVVETVSCCFLDTHIVDSHQNIN